MPDDPKTSKKPVAIIAIVVLLCVILAAWLVLKSRHKAPQPPPIAALRLDSIDQTNRVILLSDNGSHVQDPDGTLRNWRIAWGDGKEDNLSVIPQKAGHTYASEGEYTISLWCVDNLGATSSVPAMTNITFDFLKRQKALELAQAEAQREADRLKAEAARKEAERIQREQEMQKQLAAQEAQKAMQQQEMEAKRKAEAELARQKAEEAAKAQVKPPPHPLAAGLPDNSSSGTVIFTPSGYALGEFQISKEKTEGKGNDGNLLVILVIRCVNFPDTPIATSDWQFEGKELHVPAGRIRASLSPGRHEVSALFTPKLGTQPKEIKASITVQPNGECVVTPEKSGGR